MTAAKAKQANSTMSTNEQRTNEELDALRLRVANWMTQQGLSQNQVALAAGVHKTTLSQYMNSKYPAKSEGISQALERWLDQESRKQTSVMPVAPTFITTPTANKIMAALTYAQLAGDMAVIFGGAGLGKTETLRHFAQSREQVWLVDCTPGNKRWAALMRAIAHRMNLHELTGTTDMKELYLQDELRNTGGLLILDEAQFLSQETLESVRRLVELAGIGLALSGNERVYTQLTGGNRSADFAQLFSRIGKRIPLSNKPLKADVESLAHAWGVGGAGLNLLRDIANQPGALRIVTKTLRLATMFSRGANTELSAEHIRAAWKDLGGLA